MRLMKLSVGLVSSLLALAAAAEYAPAAWNLKAREDFAARRFGIFIHWGLYSNYAQGEWYLQTSKLDENDYSRMRDGFCPSKFDADEWVRVFKNAGAKYVTVTSRHHDGFSLWPSKADDGYNIGNTPFKRDILGEIAAACARRGLELNLYYSLMDWHRPDYPAGTTAEVVRGKQSGDYPSYKRFMLGQLAELIDGYHPGVIWFDGEWDHAECVDGKWVRTLDWQMDDLYDFIHSKHVLTANNNHQPIRPKEDIQLFERDLPGSGADSMFSKDQPVTDDRPIEQCDVIQTGGKWGYQIADQKFRTPAEVVAIVARAAAKGSNLLMNVGPDGSGRLPAKVVTILGEVGKWFAKNGESIYGTAGCPIARGRDIVSTRKGKVLYLHFLKPGVDEIAFRVDGEIASVRYLATGADVPVTRDGEGRTAVKISRPADDPSDVVVELTLK